MPLNAEGLNYKFCDFDGIKKKELERRKILRLEQVRQQSKELSIKLRERVAREKHRQIRNIEQIKAKELQSWKQQHVNAATNDYYYCLSNVGDAHVAAERENEVEEQIKERQRKNREIAMMRGRKAIEKEKLKHSKKNEIISKRVVVSNVKKKIDKKIHDKDPTHPQPRAIKETIHNVSLADDEEKDETHEELIDVSSKTPINILSKSPKPFEREVDDNIRFSQISDLIAERLKSRNLCEEMLQEMPMRSELIAAKYSNRPINNLPMHPQCVGPNDKSPKRPLTIVAKSPKQAEKCQKKQPTPPAKAAKITVAPAPKPLITNRKSPPPRKSMPEPIQKDKSKPKGFLVDSLSTFRRSGANPKVRCNTTSTQQAGNVKPIVRSKSSSLQRREYVPRFTTEPFSKPGILKKSSSSTVIPPTGIEPTENASRVQFYDHFNRYGMKYDADPSIVQRETHPPTLTAAEAAKKQNEVDDTRMKQLEELRQRSQQRCMESLEKNQIRKDYDLLTKQLAQLSKQENILRTFAMPNEEFSEERIRQMARNRQQSMNNAFEDIQHKPVVITCPSVRTDRSSVSSDLNVAVSPMDEPQRNNPFDSSESCTSILLGYVDNRSRKIAKEIKQSKDRDKTDELINLLVRLDRLRELLKEEIKRNGSPVATSNLEEFYRSVMELDKEKKDILGNRDGKQDEQNQQAELAKREQLLELKEQKLERKMKELFSKKKKEERVQHEIFESLSSESTTSVQSEPVKILIEVKSAAKIRKTKSPKKIQVISNQGVGSKIQHVPHVQGSSSSTSYRSPPNTYRTPLTNALSNKAAPSKQTKIKATQPPTASVQKPSLEHYITRLLGMSRPSIDQLCVSSFTSIGTPSSSIIENPQNIPQLAIDENLLNKIESEMHEHRRFAKEVDDSLNKSCLNEMKNVWMKMLDKQQKDEENVSEHRRKKVKVAKKKPENSSKESTKENEKPVQRDQFHSNDEVVRIQPDVPENSKRLIAHLTKKIEQVRQEKQKLLEKTMSSAHSTNSSSGKGFDSTEYRDFVIPKGDSKSSLRVEENNISSQVSDILSSPGHLVEEEPKNLMSTKQTGISFSRDSGIGSSRPVTSTDFRVSPDIKMNDKSSVLKAAEPMVMVTDENTCDGPVDTNAKLMPIVNSGSCRKLGKPPISLKRFSPQLDTEQLQPHDLSTINEIETSATSRLNPSTQQDSSDSSVSAKYNKFPTFFEYKRLHKNTTPTDNGSEDKSISETDLKEMLEMSSITFTGLHYRKLNEQQPDDKKSDTESLASDIGDDYIDVRQEILKRNLLSASDTTTSTSIDSKKLTTSNSSDILAKDFNQIGLNWASVMLKKTTTAQNLESSSSSCKSSANIPRNEPSNKSPDICVTGNPLNIREFLMKELLKRTQSNSSNSASDNSTLTDQFIKSLSSNSTHSSTPQQATHRTSTPVRLTSAESDRVANDENIPQLERDEINFFSGGESYLSSVRGTTQSETSGGKETSE